MKDFKGLCQKFGAAGEQIFVTKPLPRTISVFKLGLSKKGRRRPAQLAEAVSLFMVGILMSKDGNGAGCAQ